MSDSNKPFEQLLNSRLVATARDSLAQSIIEEARLTQPCTKTERTQPQGLRTRIERFWLGLKPAPVFASFVCGCVVVALGWALINPIVLMPDAPISPDSTTSQSGLVKDIQNGAPSELESLAHRLEELELQDIWLMQDELSLL